MQEQTLALLERIRNFAMPGGSVDARGTWIRQVGEMRFAPDRQWLPFEAEQWFDGGSIDFRWEARVRMAPFVRARVVDSFTRGRGALTARVFGIVPVARSRGPTTDQGEALRGLAELPWRPFGFRDRPWIAWETAAADRLRATFDDGRTQATVELDVDAEGRIPAVTASSRPRLVGKSVVGTAWSGAFGEYRTFDSVRVPTVAEVAWHLPEGAFTYWRGRITELRVLR